MRRIKNKNVVYSGVVGQNMKPKRYRNSVACLKTPVMCEDGPMAGVVLFLHDNSPTTAFFTLHGKTGRYSNGQWELA